MQNLPKSRRYNQWLKIISVVAILSSLLASCNLPWQVAEESATQKEEIKIREDTQALTEEPRKDLPPSLVEVSPVSGSIIGLNQSISLYFNQPMDIDSVEAAIHFEPRINGHFFWENDQILTFEPDQKFSQNQNLYRQHSANIKSRKHL